MVPSFMQWQQVGTRNCKRKRSESATDEILFANMQWGMKSAHRHSKHSRNQLKHVTHKRNWGSWRWVLVGLGFAEEEIDWSPRRLQGCSFLKICLDICYCSNNLPAIDREDLDLKTLYDFLPCQSDKVSSHLSNEPASQDWLINSSS